MLGGVLSDDKINLLAKVARTPRGTSNEGVTDTRSILTLAAASFGGRPMEEATHPTGFDPFAAALFECIVEGAYLVASADGVFDEEERSVFERVVTAACGDKVSSSLVAGLVSDLAEQLAEDGLDRRIVRLAASVLRKEQAREVLRIAALMASASEDVSATERDVLERLARAFGLEPNAVEVALGEVRSAMRTDEPKT